jgi:hypothetical protein
VLAEATVAAAAKDGKGKRPKVTPPPTEWDTPTEVMAAIFDRIGALIVAVQNGYAAEPIREAPPPYPRPVTETERAKKRADDAEDHALNDLIAQAHETHRRQLNREG